jgi:hypothetical protein
MSGVPRLAEAKPINPATPVVFQSAVIMHKRMVAVIMHGGRRSGRGDAGKRGPGHAER